MSINQDVTMAAEDTLIQTSVMAQYTLLQASVVAPIMEDIEIDSSTFYSRKRTEII